MMRMAWVSLMLLAAMVSACGSEAPLEGVGQREAPTPVPFVRDCAWLSHEDPELMNVFFPDTEAHYWLAPFVVPPGGELYIEGEFPHARYMSFNLYDPALSPFEGISDVEILPEAGHHNPFLPGANRNGEDRRYRLRVVPQPAPEDPVEREPNTLYAGVLGLPMPVGVMMYRVYVPDRGTSLSGNVDLPDLRFHVGGIELPVPDACALLEQTRLNSGLNEVIANLDLSAIPVPLSPTDPLAWQKFHNPALTVLETLGRAGLAGTTFFDAMRELLLNSGLRGGYLSNRDNAYIATPINNSAGEMVVMSAIAPRLPPTYDNVPLMADADLRYLSLCSVDFPTQRYWDCVYDEQLSLDADNGYVIVVSHAGDRPANARPECGITWVNWGPLASAALIMRHMLPSPDFAHSVQNIIELDSERTVLGPYYPNGTYSSRQQIESWSANPQGNGEECRIDTRAVRAWLAAG